MWNRSLVVSRFLASRLGRLPPAPSSRLAHWPAGGAKSTDRVHLGCHWTTQVLYNFSSGCAAAAQVDYDDDYDDDDDYYSNETDEEYWLFKYEDPVEHSTSDSSSQVLQTDSAREAIEAIHRGSPMVVIEKKDGAFFLVVEFTDRLRELLEKDLSGVTEQDYFSFDFGNETFHVHAAKTYNARLVVEFVELVSKALPGTQIVITDAAQASIDSHDEEKEQRRGPISEVEAVRNPEIPLLPHQHEAVRFFIENDGRGLLADEMGLGE